MRIFNKPTDNDIRQMKALFDLGCAKIDIAQIVGVTIGKLNDWEKSYIQVGEIFKPKARPEYTMLHPEYAPMVEEAFACAGKRYYRFKEEYRMSTGRYKYYYAALREVEMHMNLETLKAYLEAFKSVLNGGKKGRIEITEIHKLVLNLESRLTLAFDPQTIRDIAAIAYFDDTEDLTTYDRKYGKQKIDLWLENNVTDFFLTRPIAELFQLNTYSEDSLLAYLTEADQVIRDLNSNLLKASEDNSSENGSPA